MFKYKLILIIVFLLFAKPASAVIYPIPCDRILGGGKIHVGQIIDEIAKEAPASKKLSWTGSWDDPENQRAGLIASGESLDDGIVYIQYQVLVEEAKRTLQIEFRTSGPEVQKNISNILIDKMASIGFRCDVSVEIVQHVVRVKGEFLNSSPYATHKVTQKIFEFIINRFHHQHAYEPLPPARR